MPGKPPVIGIAGWKKSGKTTLVTRLVAEFTRRGLKVATVKHAHHDFQIDDGRNRQRPPPPRRRRPGRDRVGASGGRVINELEGAPEPAWRR